MSLERNLAEMERCREAYWLRYPATSPSKLKWRALAVRHSFHVLPGETVLELGAGGGLWTRHLSCALRGESPITAAVFNGDLLPARDLPGVRFVHVRDLERDLPAGTFDYVAGTAILCHDACRANLRAIHRLLKPGGRLLFFEANYWNPQVALKNAIPWIGRRAGNAGCQIGLRRYRLMKMASREGFTELDIVPYDIVHPLTPRFLVEALQSVAFVAEHAPLLREVSGTLYISARKPGGSGRREFPDLARHECLRDAVSFVVPCHNEEMNIAALVEAILGFYGAYVHEIVLVNDNSTDGTAAAIRRAADQNRRVRLVHRTPPAGVGRALRDGYAAATGRYILSMDCDFVSILPEFRELFDVVAAGHDGAIGSRFSHESLLIDYPFLKILCNRGFHLLANLLLPGRVRDISNNLKLYRAEILKTLAIRQDHFPANVETGLKPLLAGYDIREVPVSWMNRTADMGTSSFRIASVGAGYLRTLLAIAYQSLRGREVARRVGA